MPYPLASTIWRPRPRWRSRPRSGRRGRCHGIDTSSTTRPAPRSVSVAARTVSSTAASELGWPKPSVTTPTRSPDGVAGERGHVVVGDEVAGLAGVEPVRPGDHVQHERGVGDRARDRADVVDGRLDGERAGVGHEAPRRLVPDRAACRRSGCAPSRPGRRRWRRPRGPRSRAPRCPRTTRPPSASRPTGCGPGPVWEVCEPPEKQRSSQTALPVIVAPAARTRETTVASRSGV